MKPDKYKDDDGKQKTPQEIIENVDKKEEPDKTSEDKSEVNIIEDLNRPEPKKFDLLENEVLVKICVTCPIGKIGCFISEIEKHDRAKLKDLKVY